MARSKFQSDAETRGRPQVPPPWPAGAGTAPAAAGGGDGEFRFYTGLGSQIAQITQMKTNGQAPGGMQKPAVVRQGWRCRNCGRSGVTECWGAARADRLFGRISAHHKLISISCVAGRFDLFAPTEPAESGDQAGVDGH